MQASGLLKREARLRVGDQAPHSLTQKFSDAIPGVSYRKNLALVTSVLDKTKGL